MCSEAVNVLLHNAMENKDDLLKYAVENGMIDLSYVQEQIEMKKGVDGDSSGEFIFVKDGDRISTQAMRMRLKRICKNLMSIINLHTKYERLMAQYFLTTILIIN